MAHQLARTVRQPILADGAWDRNCTNTVVCWLWCVNHNHLQGDQADPASGGGFEQLLTGGLLPRSTPRFLNCMAKEVGRRRAEWGWFSPWKGSLVLWVGATVVHAAVNGGGNEMYGYNQNGHLSSCLHAFNVHCHHNADDIQYAQGVRIYTVKPGTAIEYFSMQENNYAKW